MKNKFQKSMDITQKRFEDIANILEKNVGKFANGEYIQPETRIAYSWFKVGFDAALNRFEDIEKENM